MRLCGRRAFRSFQMNFFSCDPVKFETVTVSFKPTARMPEFQRELRMLVCGREMPLVVVSAFCEDAEVHLDVQNILFNDVVVGTTAFRRIVIMNSGDISQRFRWDPTLSTQSEMRVVPPTGLVRAHSEQVCEFVYTPKMQGTSLDAMFVWNLMTPQPQLSMWRHMLLSGPRRRQF
ncbi:hypothetical protein C3747_138g6 [Trypanosoma cruzi]|uniref:Uncharacterized protein n=1 Tax=Trypanosoma cruzi TaxID=5693 RepID=A0A2V2WBQ0_TRYCR|nr:hypothetical protein C3747_138g6 [Trypanosoma cruzi]